MTLFAIVMIPLLLRLGTWQVQRGSEKRDLENQYLAQLTQLPVPPTGFTMSQPFRALRLTGEYRDEMFLVDNQVSNGKTGYWVFQVFNDDSAGRLLLNRGFIEAQGRLGLPRAPRPRGKVSLVATVWPQLGLIPAWGEQIWADGWPKRIQRANVARMAEVAETWPAELRLERGEAGVLQPAPFASRLSDAKHRGYAATWFGLAAVLFLGFIYVGFSSGKRYPGP